MVNPAEHVNPVRSLEISTPQGPARAHLYAAQTPSAVVVLSHGAGGGVEAPDLVALAQALPEAGYTVITFEQAWRVAGKPLASPPKTLDAGLAAAVDQAITAWKLDGVPLIVGGRSAGARSACRSAQPLGALGAIALAFPLHPPGKPEKSRLDELDGAGVPVLVLQGGRDTFGRPDEFPEFPEFQGVPAHSDRRLVSIPAGDHSFKVLKRDSDQFAPGLAKIVTEVTEWIAALLG